MDEIIKSGILGIITIVILFVGAYFINEMDETQFEHRINIKKKEVKVDVVTESRTPEALMIKKNSEAAF